VRDEDMRTSCFASLDVLCAKFGGELPYRGGLDAGFPFRGHRVPFLTPYKGIFRARGQTGPAALSINTSYDSSYDDQDTEDGFLYAYRTGPIDQPDNVALSAAHELGVPLVYFVGTQPGLYRPEYPCFITQDLRLERRVMVTPGSMIGPLDEREPVLAESTIERRYAVRQARVRLHQARFRGRVIPAYRNQCAICRLKETRLLDAAHILEDRDPHGEPEVPNGLSLCTIHHRAFDQNLVGVAPDCRVHVSARLLDDEDGPMLTVLKTFHGTVIEVPTRRTARPDPDRLSVRFQLFEAATGA
jgi:putative restriction endonuclease